MSRSLTLTTGRHFKQSNTAVFWMGEFQLRGENLYLHTDIGDINWNGLVWKGLGVLGNVEPIVEDERLSPTQYSCTLSGLDRDLVSKIENDDHVGTTVILYMAARNQSTGELIGAPFVMLRGPIDKARITVNAVESTVSFLVFDERALLERSDGIRLSHEQQIKRNPGDGILEFAADLVNATIEWGPNDLRRTIPDGDDDPQYS